MTRRRGLTLAEAIVSIFVMLAGIVVMVRLFHTSLRYQTLVDNQSTAVMLAERELERVRGWSRKNHTSPSAVLDFNNFLTDSYPGKVPYEDPDYPGFKIQTEASAHTINSPCSLFEALYPAAQQRSITKACRKIKVTISWGWDPYSLAPLKHELTSLISWPTCKANNASQAASASVTTGSTSIAQGGHLNATVTATNANGQVLSDLFYNYVVEPGGGDLGGGYGTVEDARDGRTTKLHNFILNAATPPGISGYGVGRCSLRAKARYRGFDITDGVQTNIEMQP